MTGDSCQEHFHVIICKEKATTVTDVSRKLTVKSRQMANVSREICEIYWITVHLLTYDAYQKQAMAYIL